MSKRRLIGQSTERRGLGYLRRSLSDIAELQKAAQGITAEAETGSVVLKIGSRQYRVTAQRLK